MLLLCCQVWHPVGEKWADWRQRCRMSCVILTDALRGPRSPRGWKRGLWVLPHCHNHSVQQAGRRRCCSTSCLRSESTPSPGHCFKIRHFNLQISTFELHCYPTWMIEGFLLAKWSQWTIFYFLPLHETLVQFIIIVLVVINIIYSAAMTD